MTVSFHEILFPEDISYGSAGGPGFNTTVIELSSGHEQRNINWSEAKAKYEASHGVKTRDQMEELIDFFWARRGRAYGFRYKDWADYQLADEPIGTGDGATTFFQVIKTYEPAGYPFQRIIRKLNPDVPLVVMVNGVVTAATVDNNAGTVTFAVAPVVGAVITVTGEFHVPVRFDIDDMNVTQDQFEVMSWPSIPLVEIKPRSADGTIV